MKFISKTKPIRLNYTLYMKYMRHLLSPRRIRVGGKRAEIVSRPLLALSSLLPRVLLSLLDVYSVRLREGRLYIMKIRWIGIECARIRELASLSLFAFRSMGTKNIFVWADGRLQPRGYLRGGLRFERF